MFRAAFLATYTFGFTLACIVSLAQAAPITLQSPTATFSQSSFGGFPVADTLDNPTTTSWAINGASSFPVIAAWETQSDINIPGGALLTFTIAHTDMSFVTSQANIGRFRLSYTTDDRSLFADGQSTGGDVTASWIVLDPNSFSSDGGSIATELIDLSLLVSGGDDASSTYTITSIAATTGITGFRLEAIPDPSLPANQPGINGPGRGSSGNFHISLFAVDASVIPEPSSVILLGGLVLAGAAFTRKWKPTPATSSVSPQ